MHFSHKLVQQALTRQDVCSTRNCDLISKGFKTATFDDAEGKQKKKRFLFPIKSFQMTKVTSFRKSNDYPLFYVYCCCTYAMLPTYATMLTMLLT